MRKFVDYARSLSPLDLSPAVAFTQGGKTKPTTATYITKKKSTPSTRTGKEPIGTSRWSISATRTTRSASFIGA